MAESGRLLFQYVETPLHAGTGRGLGAVDLPVQRERTTGYPVVQAGGVKGSLRALTARDGRMDADVHVVIFGPETADAADHAGALAVGDARTLLFPVRSVNGVFAWTTSLDALARFRRDAARLGIDTWGTQLPGGPGSEQAWVNGNTLVAGNRVVLEEFSFTPDQQHADVVAEIGRWLAENALPQTDDYQYWRETLPQKLCILAENAFRDFLLYATEIQTHIRLDPDTKTVQRGALWTSEHLPSDTLLYSTLLSGGSRRRDVVLTPDEIWDYVDAASLTRMQLGANETTGGGVVALRLKGA